MMNTRTIGKLDMRERKRLVAESIREKENLEKENLEKEGLLAAAAVGTELQLKKLGAEIGNVIIAAAVEAIQRDGNAMAIGREMRDLDR